MYIVSNIILHILAHVHSRRETMRKNDFDYLKIQLNIYRSKIQYNHFVNHQNNYIWHSNIMSFDILVISLSVAT